MSTHTQGSWKAGLYGDSPADALKIYSADGSKLVAECMSLGNNSVLNIEEAQANARLIESAPELLGTLGALVEAINVGGEFVHDTSIYDYAGRLVSRLEGATAKPARAVAHVEHVYALCYDSGTETIRISPNKDTKRGALSCLGDAIKEHKLSIIKTNIFCTRYRVNEDGTHDALEDYNLAGDTIK